MSQKNTSSGINQQPFHLTASQNIGGNQTENLVCIHILTPASPSDSIVPSTPHFSNENKGPKGSISGHTH